MADIYDEMEWLKRSHEIRDEELIINQSGRWDKLFKIKHTFSDNVYKAKIDELGEDFRREGNAWAAQKQWEIQEERRRVDAWKAYYNEQVAKAWEKYQEDQKQGKGDKVQEQKVAKNDEKKPDKDWDKLLEKQRSELEKLMYDTFKEFAADTRGLDGVKVEELPKYIIENLDMNRDSIQRMAIRHYLELYDSDKNPMFNKVIDEEKQYLKSPEYKQMRDTQKKLEEQDKRDKAAKEKAASEKIMQKMLKMQQNKKMLDRDNTDYLTS